MFPIRADRDTQICNWDSAQTVFATTKTAADANDAQIRSDGLLKPDFGLVKCQGVTAATAANLMFGIGVHLAGPEAGSEYTLYSYTAHAWCADIELMPLLVVAISPATITSDASGDVCRRFNLIGTGRALGNFNSLTHEGVVALPNTSPIAAGRGVCFGISFATGATAGTDLKAYARIAVRRLVANEPSIIDTTKLG